MGSIFYRPLRSQLLGSIALGGKAFFLVAPAVYQKNNTGETGQIFSEAPIRYHKCNTAPAQLTSARANRATFDFGDSSATGVM
jgi:hypothetical protein